MAKCAEIGGRVRILASVGFRAHPRFVRTEDGSWEAVRRNRGRGIKSKNLCGRGVIHASLSLRGNPWKSAVCADGR